MIQKVEMMQLCQAAMVIIRSMPQEEEKFKANVGKTNVGKKKIKSSEIKHGSLIMKIFHE